MQLRLEHHLPHARACNAPISGRLQAKTAATSAPAGTNSKVLNAASAAAHAVHDAGAAVAHVAHDAGAAAVHAAEGAAEAVHHAAARITHTNASEEEETEGSEVATVVVAEPPCSLAESARAFAAGRGGRALAIAGAGFLGATFAVAVYRTWQAVNSDGARRRRTVDRNRRLVDELSKWLPGKRDQLTPAVLRVRCVVVVLLLVFCQGVKTD